MQSESMLRKDSLSAKLRFWFVTVTAIATVITWLRSYWASDLICWTDFADNTWVLSESKGALSISKCSFQTQNLWKRPPSHFGYRTSVGPDCNYPAALWAFGWMDSGPVDMLRERKGTNRSSSFGFGNQSGVIASKTAVWIKCDEISAPFWAISPFTVIPFVVILRRSFTKDAVPPEDGNNLRASLHDTN